MIVNHNQESAPAQGNLNRKILPKKNILAEKQTYFHTSNGKRFEMFESPDTSEKRLEDYRRSEVNTVLNGLQSSDYVHLDVTSGTGTSRYIVPGIINGLGGDEKVTVQQQTNLPELIRTIDKMHQGQTIILEEFGDFLFQFSKDPESVISVVKSITTKGAKLVFCVGEVDKSREILALFKTMLSSDSIPQVTVRPKPFNLQQTRDFFDTIKMDDENLNPAEVDYLFQVLVKNSGELPFHSTWLKSIVRYMKMYYQEELKEKSKPFPKKVINEQLKKFRPPEKE
ncbi:MAG: hypothetical protein NTZ55_05075 [Candidatus Roizmanbacteria bacterium]|nr:hypothetical protein [Candidatus Roizmanbacteria bacterium]